MGSGLSEGDGQAISDAIRILNEAGYTVEKVGSGSRAEGGVSFRLDVQAHTRSRPLNQQRDAVKKAAIEAPEFDMAGKVVDKDA